MIEPRRTAGLVRWFLRRDRWMLPCWIAGNVVLYVSQAVGVKGIYATQDEFDKAAAKMASNAAFIAMAGPARALNTIGGQVTWQASAFGSIVAALMSMFIVGRHTRAEEESGRDELVRAGNVGRHAPLIAAGIVAVVANALLGLAIALSLVAYGLGTAGAFALGVGAALVGLTFAGVAMVAAQLTHSTRAMYGITGATIALAYVLRAIGDVGNGVLSWFSPIGWGQAMHAYSGERWWPAALPAAAAAALAVAAFALFDHRDIGAGLWASRPGPPAAGRLLSSVSGLAWRLQRAGIAGWAAGLFLGGVAYGSMGNDVGDLIGDSTVSREIFVQGGGSLVDGFYATAIVMLALIACGFTIASALRPSREEGSGFAEVVLATAASRRRWLVGHAAVTATGTLLLIVTSGVGLAAG
jgi:ABC-2 type transport system permease protein